MRVKIFNDTKTILINDDLVERFNRHQSTLLDGTYIEFELATKGIDENTNMSTEELNSTVEKLLLESVEVFEDTEENHKKAHDIIKS